MNLTEHVPFLLNLSQKENEGVVIEKLLAYSELLIDWNDKVNLVSRQQTKELVQYHIIHSLLISRFYSFGNSVRCVDIGTGGGLPGIPLAICFPQSAFELVDSTAKKIVACQDMCQRLGLLNVQCTASRIEQVEGSFDVGLSKHVGKIKQIVRWAKHLIKPAGHLIFLKGYDQAHVELRSLKINRFSVHSLQPFGSEFEGKCLVDVEM